MGRWTDREIVGGKVATTTFTDVREHHGDYIVGANKPAVERRTAPSGAVVENGLECHAVTAVQRAHHFDGPVLGVE